jgi:hypothetical protein
MTCRVRLILAVSGFAAAAFVAGCGGGGGGGGGGSTPPVPSPTPLPTVAVNTRPLANGDSFSYAGTTAQTIVYSGVSPEPMSTTVSSVAQSIAVSGPTTYAGVANVFDLTDTETDTSPLQALAITTNTYDALVAAGATTNLLTYGYSSSDSNGESLTIQIPSGALLDELPEAKGQTWTNGPAETANETSPGGQTSVRTVNADGSYSDTTTFPAGSIYPTASPGLPPATQAVITQNADGSGSYAFFAAGSGAGQQNYLEIDLSTPRPASSGAPAMIPIVSTQPSQTPVEVDIPLWYPQPLKLYAETDANTGPATIPAACNVPASIGTRANAVTRTSTQYDTIVGTLESIVQTSYVVPTYGLACVSLSDTLQFYYDYSGQSGLAAGPTIDITATSTVPIETETIATTLGLTAGTLQPAAVARRGDVPSATAAAGLHYTNARSNFLAFVEREKQRRKSMLLARIRSSYLERFHR